ncbi:MAG: Adaptor for signal transduction [Cirrosporium novae-zelandiae]|nr:MAG: Adaptor for signal transduction [Cirrosporium novae-zelandiae]
MAFQTSTFHADSDADDEYERSVMTSPQLPTDSEASPTDSDPPSAEHTPTTYGNPAEDRGTPKTMITDWTAKESAGFIASLGLSQYSDAFIEQDIVGAALVVINHDNLKEMGVPSFGHRLTILKAIYEVKVKQDIPIGPDHYVPITADRSKEDEKATQEDISRIVHLLQKRDEHIGSVEAELRRVQEDYRKLREDLLPIFRLAKDRSQPLPPPYTLSPDLGNEYQPSISSPAPVQQQEQKSGGLHRKFSTKKLLLGSTPKNNSPTHIPQSIPQGRSLQDGNLDPSAAALAASSHLTASVTGNSLSSTSPNALSAPSPTSPASYAPTLGSRSYREGTTPSTNRSMYTHAEEALATHAYAPSTRRENPTPTPVNNSRRQEQEPPAAPPNRENTQSAAPNLEIFKSFRVSMDDPCYKVLPAALKKYNIQADWTQYALYIVYGDQERCLGLEEKPLILFKQLDREGKKPMFMLRKLVANPGEGTAYPNQGGVGQLGEGAYTGPKPGGGGQIQLPGGVL